MKLTDRGYALVYAPDHPSSRKGPYRLVHRMVVEKAIGHSLPARAEVHHIDEDRLNNTPANLVACEDCAYHNLLHARARALAACGDPNAVSCNICHSYERQDDIHRASARTAWHRDCRSAYDRDRYAVRRALAA